MANEHPAIQLGKHVLLTWGQVEAAPTVYPDELSMMGWELVTDGAGLWASQNRYNQCPPTSWYPDPRICVALTLSNHQKPGICVGQVQTGPAPARDWGKYHVGVKLSPYYRAKPAGDAAHEEAGAQLTLFAGDQ